MTDGQTIDGKRERFEISCGRKWKSEMRREHDVAGNTFSFREKFRENRLSPRRFCRYIYRGDNKKVTALYVRDISARSHARRRVAEFCSRIFDPPCLSGTRSITSDQLRSVPLVLEEEHLPSVVRQKLFDILIVYAAV